MAAPSRPTNEQLDLFARGLLDDDTADEIISYLDSSPGCEETIHGLDTSVDPFLSLLRKPVGEAEESFLQENEFQNAVASIRELTSAGQNTVLSHDAGRNENLPSVGEVIRDYQLIEIIGRGGMGVVYKARHQKLDRIVALKVLAAKSTDESMVERFQREMQAVGKLDHPNIVQALDAGDVDGLNYLVMEYVDGENLSALLRRRGELPVADACELIRQAATGLQDVHKHGLVHRDIKPGNLMVTTSGLVKILDLGLARLHGPDLSARELTTTGQLMGTIDYISPEQADNTHDADIRADIYSLGATLHALLTGRAPFGGSRYGSAMKKLVALSTEQVPRVDERRPEIPGPLADLVERMLAKDPAVRPQIPTDLANELLPFSTGNSIKRLLESDQSIESAVDTTAPGEALTQSEVTKSESTRNSDPATSRSSHSDRWWKFAAFAVVTALLLLNAGQVIRIATGKGLLIIKSEVSDIEVTVSRGDAERPVKIVDRKTKREYELEVADDYHVVVTEAATGIELRSETVTISRGGRSVLEAKVRPASEVAEGDSEEYLTDADVVEDRSTAEWAFENGARRVWARQREDGESVECLATADLPQEPFRLTGVEIQLERPLQLTQVERLSGCGRLEEVRLGASNYRFSDSCIRQLAQLPGLVSLGFSEASLTPDQVRTIVELAPQLQTFRLDRCSDVDEKMISTLTMFEQLRHLSLNGADLAAIDHTLIYSMTSLTTLDLRSCNIQLETAEEIFRALPECTIESDVGRFVPYSISGAMVPDATEYTVRENVEWAFRHGAESVAIQAPYQMIQRLDDLPDDRPLFFTGGVWTLDEPIPLEELPRLAGLRTVEGIYFNMGRFNVGDDFVSAILAWHHLEQLGLIGGDINHEQLTRIVRRFPKLTNLSLSFMTGVDDESLRIASSLKNLDSISFSGTAVTDKALRHLTNLKKLKLVQLHETGITEQGIEQLAAEIPGCRIESDFGVIGD